MIAQPGQTKMNERKIQNADFGDKLIRQGPWLFLPVNRFQIKANDIVWNQPLERVGEKTHMVDFLYRDRCQQVFVKGRIRHPDYQTIVLDEWYRVL